MTEFIKILNDTSVMGNIMRIRLRQAQLQQLIIFLIMAVATSTLYTMKAMRCSNFAIHALFLLSAMNITLSPNNYDIEDWIIQGGRYSLRDDLI